jgi:hypothetical protein
LWLSCLLVLLLWHSPPSCKGKTKRHDSHNRLSSPLHEGGE